MPAAALTLLQKAASRGCLEMYSGTTPPPHTCAAAHPAASAPAADPASAATSSRAAWCAVSDEPCSAPTRSRGCSTGGGSDWPRRCEWRGSNSRCAPWMEVPRGASGRASRPRGADGSRRRLHSGGSPCTSTLEGSATLALRARLAGPREANRSRCCAPSIGCSAHFGKP